MTTFNIALELDEVNIVLSALSQRPFVEVSGTIGNIQTQAQEQLAAIEAENAAVAEEPAKTATRK